MKILSATTDKIEVVLGAAHTTNALNCFCSYRNMNGPTGSDFLPGRKRTDTNGTTDVDISGSPASGYQFLIENITIFNADTVSHTVTVKFQDATGEAIQNKFVLSAGQMAEWTSASGWVVNTTYQPIKSFTVHGDAGANFVMTNATNAERFAGNTNRHLFMVDLLGYSQVRFRVNKQVGSTSINTPLFRAKYYTSYNTTVGNFLQLGASAQVEANMTAIGYYDSGWMDLAAGAKNDAICIGFTELGGDGVADPAVGATDILFR